MSFQTIDLGTQGTQSGDTIRNAFTKVNSNFIDAQSQIDVKADSGHVHDSRYYTQSQVDAGFRSSSWIPSKSDIQSSLLNGLLIQVNVGGDGGWNEGIIIDNIGADGEAALSWRQSEMGANYWISGVNQSPNWKLAYGTSFTDGQTKLELATDGSFLKLAGANLATQNWVSANFNNYSHPASHSISEVSGLQTALDGKAPNHTHPYRSDSWVPAVNQVTHGYTPGNLIVADTGGVLGDSGTQIEAVTTHVASTSNPHGVTAAQAGARPSSWVPAWTDITGKPTFGDSASLDLGTTAGTVSEGDHNHDSAYRSSSWVPAMSQISDVTLTSIGNGELLQYNSTLGEWINRTLAEAGVAAASHTHSTYPSKTSAETISGSYNFTNSLVEFAQRLGHYGDTNTYIDFGTDRVAIVAGGTTRFDTNLGAALQCSTGNVLDIDFDEGTGELFIKAPNFWWTSGKIFAKA